jgi:nucleoside-diphosphate-sugar epimerase
MQKAGHAGIALSRTEQNLILHRWTNRLRQRLLSDQKSTDCDAIIHLEVKQHVSNPSGEDLAEFKKVNVEGTQEWLDWASRNGVKKFVFFSSIKAVGDSPECQDEACDSIPNTPYGKSKREAEERVRAWAAGSPERSALILRPAVVYGPGNQANMLSLVEAIHRRRFFLIGRNENIKSLISLKNLVAAVAHLLTVPFRGCELFYLTDRESYSVSRIASMVAEILGRSPKLPALPYPLAKAVAAGGDLFTSVTSRNFPLTSSRLRALKESTHFSSKKLQSTGFVHAQSTREGLEEMVAWYLAQKSDPKSFQ